MIQFFVEKIFEKTQKIIEHFNDDPLVQKLFYQKPLTVQEERDFLFRYFPDATEELFRADPAMKKQYLEALKSFFREKYVEGNQGFDFMQKLIMPTTNEGGGFTYTEESLRQWRRFALGTATELKGPTAVVLPTRDGKEEVVSYHELGDEDFEKKFAPASKAQVKEKMKAQFLEKVKKTLPKAQFSDASFSVIEVDGELKVRADVPSSTGEVFSVEISERQFAVGSMEVFHPLRSTIRTTLSISEFSKQVPSQMPVQTSVQTVQSMETSTDIPELVTPNIPNTTAVAQVIINKNNSLRKSELSVPSEKMEPSVKPRAPFFGGVMHAKRALASKKRFMLSEKPAIPASSPAQTGQQTAPSGQSQSAEAQPGNQNENQTPTSARPQPQRQPRTPFRPAPQRKKPAAKAAGKFAKWALISTGVISGAGFLSFFF